jgi:hypothetical protein
MLDRKGVTLICAQRAAAKKANFTALTKNGRGGQGSGLWAIMRNEAISCHGWAARAVKTVDARARRRKMVVGEMVLGHVLAAAGMDPKRVEIAFGNPNDYSPVRGD